MKKVIVVLGMLTSVLFISCDNDDSFLTEDIYETDKQLIDKGNNGEIDPGGEEEY